MEVIITSPPIIHPIPYNLFSAGPYYIKKRFIQSVMLGLCVFVAYITRVNLSVAIVSMTDTQTTNNVFNWTQEEKSYVLSSFFFGYAMTQIPAAILAQYTSPKLILVVTNLISPIIVALSPSAAFYGGWKLLSICRATLGLCQGCLFPLTFNLSAKWFPPDERNILIGISVSGATLGVIVAFPLCGAIAYSSGGWPAIFYMSAGLNLVWTIAWMWIGTDSPSAHTTISNFEKNYIEISLMNCSNKKIIKTPWKSIFHSKPFRALLCAQVLGGFTFGLFVTETPSFLHGVLSVSIVDNGLLSTIPYIFLLFSTFPTCWLADYLPNKGMLGKNIVRKLWTTIDMTGSSLLLLLIGFIGKSQLSIMIMLTICFTLRAFSCSGVFVNKLDLAPNFAGVLDSLANTGETIAALLAPLFVGQIVNDVASLNQWWTMFALSAVISITGNIIFVLYGSTEIEPWNSLD